MRDATRPKRMIYGRNACTVAQKYERKKVVEKRNRMDIECEIKSYLIKMKSPRWQFSAVVKGISNAAWACVNGRFSFQKSLQMLAVNAKWEQNMYMKWTFHAIKVPCVSIWLRLRHQSFEYCARAYHVSNSLNFHLPTLFRPTTSRRRYDDGNHWSGYTIERNRQNNRHAQATNPIKRMRTWKRQCIAMTTNERNGGNREKNVRRFHLADCKSVINKSSCRQSRTLWNSVSLSLFDDSVSIFVSFLVPKELSFVALFRA